MLFSFILYLAAVAALAYAAWRRTHGVRDFVLGGRSLGPGVSALSAGASDMSGWLLLGLPGFAYSAGMQAVWLAFGLAVGTWLNWRLVAPRLRLLSAELGDALTIPEYLARRFPAVGTWLRVIAGLIILGFFVVYTVAGLVAAGKLFETVFHIPYEWAVLAGLAAVLLYTLAGGFLAVSWTDALQAGLMGAALVVVPLAAMVTAPADASALPDGYLAVWRDLSGEPLGMLALGSLLGWGLGYFGQPHILARFMALGDGSQMPRARRLAVIWVLVALVGAVFVGVAGRVWYGDAIPGGDPEKVFLLLAEAVFPPWLAGLLLAAVLAAVMSTADSQLLVAATALGRDLRRDLRRDDTTANDRRDLVIGRLAVLGIGLLAGWLALQENSGVLALVAYAWAGFGAAFGPVLLLSLYWPAMRPAGAIAGLATGALGVAVWHNLDGGLFDLYALVPAFVLALLAALIAGRLGPTVSPERVSHIRRIVSDV